MSDYDKGGHLPPPRLVKWNVLYYIALGSDDDGAYELKFDTQVAALEYATEHGGDVYPVVDVKVIE